MKKLSIDETFKTFASDENGLSDSSLQERIKDYGYNELVAIEEMAGMDILCSDKTGTIAKNELTLDDVVPNDKFTSDDVLVYASLASREEDNDPIDTAIMIVLLALFNDAPIMAIAYDNVKYSPDPERWNMRVLLSMATFLGLIGVVSSFGIFYIGQEVLHLPKDVVQTFIFLKRAVAGHLTIFVTRTRGPFWSIRPSAAMFWSAVSTKILATLVAVYGWFIIPISWKLAHMVWGYAIVAFLITDFLKIRIYKVLDHENIKFSKFHRNVNLEKRRV